MTFTVEATTASLRAAVEQFVAAGEITPESEQPLLASIDAAGAAIARGDTVAAKGALGAIVKKVEALAGKKLSPAAAAILASDATAIGEGLD